MKLCSASSASASVAVTRVLDAVDAGGHARAAGGEVVGDAFADRARLADVEQLAVAAVEEVDAGRVGQRAALVAIRSARVGPPFIPLGHRPKGRLLATRPNGCQDGE